MPTPEPNDVTLSASRPGPDDTASAVPTHAPGLAAPDFLAAPHRPDEIGRLGRYRVLAVLGRGGMGMVLRAEDPVLRRQVALKVMLPKVAAHPNARERFLREARAQAAVEHDHVVPIFDVVDDATPFLAMPLLKGMTLAAALKANPRPPLAAVVRIGREVAEGLAAAHAQGLVHRDIKPGNVWLEAPRLRVRVLDFGLARPNAEFGTPPEEAGPNADAGPDSSLLPPPSSLTEAGAVVGTPAYMSPEQARGEPLDPRTDLFSLGVVLYQMTTGRLPFTGPTTAAVLHAVVSDHPAGLAEVEPPLPPALNALVTRLLAKDPADRPATAAEVADELRGIELGLTAAAGVQVVPLDPVPGGGPNPFADLDATEPTAAAPAARPRRRSKLQLALGLLGLVVVAGLTAGLVRVMTPRAESPPEEAKRSNEEEKEKDRKKQKERHVEPEAVAWAFDPEVWQAGDGRLVGRDPGRPKTDTWAVSRRAVADFELSARFQVTGPGTFTVAFRGDPVGLRQRDTAPRLVVGPNGYVTTAGGLVLREGPKKSVEARPGEPHDLAVVARGRRVTVRLDGATVADGEFDVPPEGLVGFRVAGAGREVVIRDLSLRELPPFVPPDLAGWTGDRVSWTAADGRLEGRQQTKGGMAVLWSERRYTDFDLRFRVRVDGRDLGGSPAVLFRATPGADPLLRSFAGAELKFNPGRGIVLVARTAGDTNTTRALQGWINPGGKKGPKLAADTDLDVTLRCVGKRVAVTADGAELFAGEYDLAADGVIGWTAGMAKGVVFSDVRFTDLAPTDPDRAAAEALNPYLILYLKLGSGKSVRVDPGTPLPAEPYAVTALSSAAGKALPPEFVRDTALPAVARLGSLTKITASPARLKWAEDDLARLAGFPAARTLTELRGVVLTPKGAGLLKGFPALAIVDALAEGADDEALLRLPDLPALKTLKLDQLGRSGAVTGKGWAAVGGLRVRHLTLSYATVDAAAARAIAAMPDLEILDLYYDAVAVDAYSELARAKGLRELFLSATPVTDAGLDALAGLTGLQRLSLGGLNAAVTEPAVRRLAAKLPGCRIDYPGGRIDPGKK